MNGRGLLWMVVVVSGCLRRSRRAKEGGKAGDSGRAGRRRQQQKQQRRHLRKTDGIANASRRSPADTEIGRTSARRQFARRHRSPGWAGRLFGCQGRMCRSGRARAEQAVGRLASGSIGTLARIGETLLRSLKADRAEDKLGMGCVVLGRGLEGVGGVGASCRWRTPSQATGEH